MNHEEHNDPMQAPDEGVMPLGTGELAEEGLAALAGFEERKKISSGTIVLLIVIALAIGGLLSMRTVAKVTAAVAGLSDIEKEVDAILGRRSGENGDGMLAEREHVLTVLTDDYVERQVPLVDVQKNPFVMYQEPTAGDVGPLVPVVDQVDAEREQFLAQARNAAESLSVKSIMGGGSPHAVANLDGEIVKAGNVIVLSRSGVEFTIDQIDRDGVVVVTEDVALGAVFRHKVKLDLGG